MDKTLSGKMAVLISKADQIQESALEIIRSVGVVSFVDMYLRRYETENNKIETEEQAIMKSATTLGFSMLLEKAIEDEVEEGVENGD